MEPHSHKYHLKSVSVDRKPRSNSINFSRSIGTTGNWIGCGFVDKSGVDKEFNEVMFPFYSLVYVVQGEGQYIDEKGMAYPLMGGCFFQRRPGLKHSSQVEPDSNWKEYYLDCNTELYQHISSMSLIEKQIPVHTLSQTPSIPKEFEKLLNGMAKCNEDSLPDVYLDFLKLIRLLFNWNTGSCPLTLPEDMVEKSCLDFEHLFDKRFDLRGYCEQNGWGYESFRKSFKKARGLSPGKYLVRRRMDEACRLLRSTPMRISEIATRLGYASQYEFSNQFKKQFNVFPKHFRDGVK